MKNIQGVNEPSQYPEFNKQPPTATPTRELNGAIDFFDKKYLSALAAIALEPKGK